MKIIARAGQLSFSLLVAFHAYAALRLLLVLLHGRTTEWQLFDVINCCDIPSLEIVRATAAIVVQLAVAAGIGTLIAIDLWRFKRWAWWGSVVLCALIIAVQQTMTSGKVASAQGEHWEFIALCFIPFALLVVGFPLYTKGKRTTESPLSYSPQP